MKKLAALLVAAILLVSAVPFASAEGKCTILNTRDANLNRYSGAISYRPEDSRAYRLITPDGETLLSESEGYTTMSPTYDYPFFKVERPSADGVHDEGLIDSTGRVLVPAEYIDVSVVSDRWQTGIKAEPSNADDKDYTVTNYSNNEKSFYRISTIDFYFDGVKVGTLNRSDYDGYPSAYGAYICVTNRERVKVFYNSRMERSPREAEYSGEFDSTYKNGKYTYYHQGSGQVAFVPECTLNPDDLQNPYLYDRGILYDVSGNVVFKPAQNYESIREFKDGYALVRMNRYYGLIDIQGNEIIPPEYDDLGNYESHPLQFGYISAVKDGKFGFLDAQGNVTCEFKYPKDIVSNRSTFATVKNLDGTIIVLSAAVGELPEHYADVSFPGSYGCMAFEATNSDKQKCIVDLYGNTLLPYSDDNRYMYLSCDGRTALVSMPGSQYAIWQFDLNSPQAPQEPEPQVTLPLPGVPAAPAAPAGQADEGWVCANGHGGNYGKFCAECGSPKPVVEEPAVIEICPSCGYDFGGSVPKFCPNCGSPVQQ